MVGTLIKTNFITNKVKITFYQTSQMITNDPWVILLSKMFNDFPSLLNFGCLGKKTLKFVPVGFLCKKDLEVFPLVALAKRLRSFSFWLPWQPK